MRFYDIKKGCKTIIKFPPSLCVQSIYVTDPSILWIKKKLGPPNIWQSNACYATCENS